MYQTLSEHKDEYSVEGKIYQDQVWLPVAKTPK